MPFLSEEIWQQLPESVRQDSESVMLAPYPKSEDFPQDEGILKEVAHLQEMIAGVRRLRADMGLSPRVPLKVLVEGEIAEVAQGHEGALAHLAGVEGVALLVGEPPKGAATVPVQGGKLILPLEGAVDIDAERERLDKEIAKVGKDVTALSRRLGNQKFVAKAPEHVVQDFRDKLVTANEKLEQLQSARQGLA